MTTDTTEKEREIEDAKTRPGSFTDDPRWAAAERIAASQNFVKSGRLSGFLLHIVRCAVEGRTAELTEQQIGIQAFGRSSSYNPSEDNIVRTTARQLRQRLALYYQEEGFADRIRIQVPRGGYVPVFSMEEATPQFSFVESPVPAPIAPVAVALPVPAPPAQEISAPLVVPSRPRSVWRYVAALLVGASAALLVDHGFVLQQQQRPSASAADPIWAEIFTPGRTTIFVPGDAGLNLYNLYSARPEPLSLSEYINSSHKPIQLENLANGKMFPEGLMAYIPISDLMLADRLSKVASSRTGQYEIHNGQNMSSGDFRNANAILSGAPPYNPWVELFDDKLNFHFIFNGIDRSMRVVNQHPQPGEQATYLYDQNPDHPLGYGYIALTDNLEGNGKVLLVEGTSLVGVDAAVSFLFNDKKMGPVIAKAIVGGGKVANFEVLLEAPFLKLNAGDVKVVGMRLYPNE
jgi:hypothetical protein